VPASAADAVHSAVAKLTKPKKKSDRAVEPLDGVTIHLWLPDGVPTLRGVLVNPFYDKAVGQKHWQEAARLWGFGVVGANYFGVPKPEFGPSLVTGLTQLGTELKRPELAHVPFLFVGMSAGGGMSVQFAEQLADRTIAAAPVCLEVGPTTAAGRAIPMLTVFGDRDGKQFEILSKKLPDARAAGALWGIAPQWGRKHEFGQANNLVLPFFDSCVRLRLPADADARQGPVKLNPLKQEDGWVGSWSGNPATGSIRKFADAPTDVPVLSWFPDHRTAAVWRAFVTQKPGLSITAPASLGDGKPFQTYPANEKLTVTGKTTHLKTFLRDGPHQIAVSDADPTTVTVEKLAPGIHTLILFADDDGGAGFGPSRPVTLVVPRK
jgi:hypothetical protein